MDDSAGKHLGKPWRWDSRSSDLDPSPLCQPVVWGSEMLILCHSVPPHNTPSYRLWEGSAIPSLTPQTLHNVDLIPPRRSLIFGTAQQTLAGQRDEAPLNKRTSVPSSLCPLPLQGLGFFHSLFSLPPHSASSHSPSIGPFLELDAEMRVWEGVTDCSCF